MRHKVIGIATTWVCLSLLSAGSRIQASQSLTADIQGTVTNQRTGSPLPAVNVRLQAEDGRIMNAVTDDRGQFLAPSLSPGRFLMTLSKQGFFQDAEATPGILTLKSGQHLTELPLKLMPGSSITGRILDEDRRPVEKAIVSALQIRYDNGYPILLPQRQGTGWTPGAIGANDDGVQAVTNEQGDYRLFGLVPGDYYIGVWAAPDGENTQGQYFPGVTDPGSATVLHLSSGEDKPATNIQFTAHPRFRVRFKMAAPECNKDSARQQMVMVQRSQGMRQPIAGVLVNKTLSPDIREGARPYLPYRFSQTTDSDWLSPLLYAGTCDIYRYSCIGGSPQTFSRLDVTLVDHDVDAGTPIEQPIVKLMGRISIQERAGSTLTTGAAAAIKLEGLDVRVVDLEKPPPN